MPSKEFEMILEVFKSQPKPEAITAEGLRATFEAISSRFPLAENVKCVAVDAGGVPAEWIIAPEAVEERVVYYIHGGAYVAGSINSHREMASRLSRAAGARVLLIDYRLAPENLFPAAVEDSLAGYRWLLSTGVDPARVVVAGESAGGGLTVAILVALRDAGDPLPAAAIPVSPLVDMEALGESMTTKADADPISSREGILWIANTYLGNADARTPLAAPLYADLRGLPPLLIQVGTAEVLLDDATRLAERAKSAGVDVVLEPWEDMIHMWHFFPILPEGQQAINRIGEFVREHTS